MVKRNHPQYNSGILPSAVMIGLGCCVLTTAILTVIAAYFISGEILAEQNLSYCAMAILFVSSLSGAWMSVKYAKEKRIITGMVTGAVYYLCLIAVTALFFEGRYQGLSETALLIFGGVGIVILMGLRPQKQTYSRRRKKTH